MKKETKVRELIRKMVREIMKEGFGGALKKEDREKFNDKRKKQLIKLSIFVFIYFIF